MQVGVRSMHGLVKTKILYTLPDLPFVQSHSALEMVDLNQHSQTAIHIKNEKQMRSQRTFKTSGGPLTGCSKPTTKDQILNAEILQALNMVNKNHLFSSANGDSDRFKKMFPDLKISTKYSQEETKSKYIVQFGLAPFVKDELSTDVQKTPYSFKFDETTNSPVKKQYDGYVSFFSKKLRKIVTLYIVVPCLLVIVQLMI